MALRSEGSLLHRCTGGYESQTGIYAGFLLFFRPSRCAHRGGVGGEAYNPHIVRNTQILPVSSMP